MDELVEVRDDDGVVQLFDMFIAGQWHGSRRTRQQCIAYLHAQHKPSDVSEAVKS